MKKLRISITHGDNFQTQVTLKINISYSDRITFENFINHRQIIV